MAKKDSRNDRRQRRHARVRQNVFGTPEKPRLSVFRSTKNIFVQVIDDVNGTTLAAASTLDPDIKEKAAYGGNKAAAKLVGEKIGAAAVEAGIKTVCFDRGGYLYHGRVKELADGARASGLEF